MRYWGCALWRAPPVAGSFHSPKVDMKSLALRARSCLSPRVPVYRPERGARQRLGKIDADLCFHPQRLTIRSRAGLESKAAKCFIEPLVVVAVPRPREIVRDHAPRGIDIEFGDHVRAAHFVRHRHRRN